MPAPRAIEFRYGDPSAVIDFASQLGQSSKAEREREARAREQAAITAQIRQIKAQERAQTAALQQQRELAGMAAAAQQQQRQNAAASGGGLSTARRPLDRAIEQERPQGRAQPRRQATVQQGVPVQRPGYGAISAAGGGTTSAVNNQSDQVFSVGAGVDPEQQAAMIAEAGGPQVDPQSLQAMQGLGSGGPGVTQFTPTPLLPPDAVNGMRILEQAAPELDPVELQTLAAAVQSGQMAPKDVYKAVVESIERKQEAQEAAAGNPEAQQSHLRTTLRGAQSNLRSLEKDRASAIAQYGAGNPRAAAYDSLIDKRKTEIKGIEDALKSDEGPLPVTRDVMGQFMVQAGGNAALAEQLAKRAGYDTDNIIGF